MLISEKILIIRIEDYHTHYMGTYHHGNQFWGYGTFVFNETHAEIEQSKWENNRLEYVVLHTFDNLGNFLATKHLFTGTTADRIAESDNAILGKWVLDLGDIEFGNIEVRPFQTIIDGYLFGLIPNENDGTLELQPSSTISFSEPWDGEYYT